MAGQTERLFNVLLTNASGITELGPVPLLDTDFGFGSIAFIQPHTLRIFLSGEISEWAYLGLSQDLSTWENIPHVFPGWLDLPVNREAPALFLRATKERLGPLPPPPGRP
jgi:hypothetical protein